MSTHDRRRIDQTKLNTRQRQLLAKVGSDVVGLLATYTRDLASGNVAGSRAIAKEIRALSADLARNGLGTMVANGGFRVTIRKGVGTKVVFTPIVLTSARISGALFAWEIPLRLGARLPALRVASLKQIWTVVLD